MCSFPSVGVNICEWSTDFTRTSLLELFFFSWISSVVATAISEPKLQDQQEQKTRNNGTHPQPRTNNQKPNKQQPPININNNNNNNNNTNIITAKKTTTATTITSSTMWTTAATLLQYNNSSGLCWHWNVKTGILQPKFQEERPLPSYIQGQQDGKRLLGTRLGPSHGTRHGTPSSASEGTPLKQVFFFWAHFWGISMNVKHLMPFWSFLYIFDHFPVLSAFIQVAEFNFSFFVHWVSKKKLAQQNYSKMLSFIETNSSPLKTCLLPQKENESSNHSLWIQVLPKKML